MQPITTKQHQDAAAGAAVAGGAGHPSPRSQSGSGGSGGAGAGGNSGAAGSTVAWTMGAVEVSKFLQDGEKFVKWEEVSETFGILCIFSTESHARVNKPSDLQAGDGRASSLGLVEVKVGRFAVVKNCAKKMAPLCAGFIVRRGALTQMRVFTCFG